MTEVNRIREWTLSLRGSSSSGKPASSSLRIATIYDSVKLPFST
jgi:hypothetical protein